MPRLRADVPTKGVFCIETKICLKCKEEKPIELFQKRGGKHPQAGQPCSPCKQCKRKTNDAWRAKNPPTPEQIRGWNDRNNERYHALGDARRDTAKAWRLKNRDKAGQYRYKAKLKNNYGITIQDFEDMVAKQGNLCAICQKPELFAKSNGKLSIDHDHETGKVRELLCRRCNFYLSYIENSDTPIEKYLEYLEKHNG